MVSNWFINARVRLWEPMVEEMYEHEQIGSAENSSLNSINAPVKAPPNQDLHPSSHSIDELSTITASKSSMGRNAQNSSSLKLPGRRSLDQVPKNRRAPK